MDNGLSIESTGPKKPISAYCALALEKAGPSTKAATLHRACKGTTVTGQPLPVSVLYVDGVAPQGGGSRLGPTVQCSCACHAVVAMKGSADG